MRRFALFLLLAAEACGWNAAGSTRCRPVGGTLPLPDDLAEASGVAWSRVRPEVLLSHNDGGDDPVVYALDLRGYLVGEIPLLSVRNRDWEDIATSPCEGGSCIYVADVGDNEEVRDSVFLYRFIDSGLYDGRPVQVDVFPMRLPGGPRDVEALFVLPGERVFLVSKGRSDSVTLYRYPTPLRAGETVTLEAVQALSHGRLPIPRQVTGAAASPDGSVVAIRSYEALTFYQWDEELLVPVEGGTVALRTLNEAQGEGVELGSAGQVVLTSEGALGRGPTMSRLTCPLWDARE